MARRALCLPVLLLAFLSGPASAQPSSEIFDAGRRAGATAASAASLSAAVQAAVPVEEAKLLASDGTTGSALGFSVSLSGDRALVGAREAAYVFVRSGGTWVQEAKLTASDGAPNDSFGSTVSLSGDRALIGSFASDGGGGTRSGSAYVFVRSGETWAQEAKLTASDGTFDDRLGYSVSLSGDRALLGAPGDAGVIGPFSGSAYVFVRSGGTWAQEAKLTASDGTPNSQFGRAVTLLGDRALVGAPYEDAGAQQNVGSTYVFARSGGAWTQEAELTASTQVAYAGFGVALSLSGDRALIGANYDDGVAPGTGSAYVFARSGGTWTQEAKLVSSDGAADDSFGDAVSLSGDRALVGSVFSDSGGDEDSGSAYVFARSGGAWTQEAKLVASDETEYYNVGYSVSLLGSRALVGVPFADGGGVTNRGAGYVFDLDPVTTPPETPVAFAVVQDAVSETAGTYALALVADGDVAPGDAVTVRLVAGDPAGLGGFTSATVPVSAGRVLIPIRDNRTPDPERRYVFALADAVGVAIGAPSLFTLVVLDDDAGNVTVTVPAGSGPRLIAVPVGGVTARDLGPTVYVVDAATGGFVVADPGRGLRAGEPVLVGGTPGGALTVSGPPAAGALALTVVATPAGVLVLVSNPTGGPLPLSAVAVTGASRTGGGLVFDGAFRAVLLGAADRTVPPYGVVALHVTPAAPGGAVTAAVDLGQSGSAPPSTPSVAAAPPAGALALTLSGSGGAPGDQVVVAFAAPALGVPDLRSPVGATLAAAIGGGLFASVDGSAVRPDAPLTIPLAVSVTGAGPSTLSLSAPSSVDGRPLTAELLVEGVAVALPYTFSGAGGSFVLRVSVAPGTAGEAAAGGDAVGAVYPNPTAGGASVRVTVGTAQAVRVSVVDALGREVLVAFDEAVAAGVTVRVPLATESLAPGVYAVRVEGATVRQARRLTVAR